MRSRAAAVIVTGLNDTDYAKEMYGNDGISGGDGDDNIRPTTGSAMRSSAARMRTTVYADPNDVVYYGCETVRIDR